MSCSVRANIDTPVQAMKPLVTKLRPSASDRLTRLAWRSIKRSHYR